MANQKHFFIDLFAGCGGLSLGLEQAGFEPILVNELSDEARSSYLINREELEHFQQKTLDDPKNPWVWKDVKDLRKYIAKNQNSFDDLVEKKFGISISNGELGMIVGGPPCQGFSGIGHRRSYAVDKKHIPSNHLYQDMLFLIENLKPKMFLFENVRGLLSARWYRDSPKGEIWKDIRAEYKKHLGDDYHIGWHLVRASEYGVPQNRPRVLMVGVRKNLAWSPDSTTLDDDDLLLHDIEFRAGGLLPKPDGKPPSLEDLLGDLVDDSYFSGQEDTDKYPKPVSTKAKSVQRLLRTSKDGKNVAAKGTKVTEHEYSNHSQKVIDKFEHMIDNKGVIKDEHKTKKFAQRLLPKKWKDGKPTITATSLPDDYVHFSQPRILSVREWARLQMFPDWYQFDGKRTTGGIRRAGNPQDGNFDREVPKYTQIGNAVPVLLAHKLGGHFKSILK